MASLEHESVPYAPFQSPLVAVEGLNFLCVGCYILTFPIAWELLEDRWGGQWHTKGSGRWQQPAKCGVSLALFRTAGARW